MKSTIWKMLLALRERVGALQRPLKFCAFSPNQPDAFFADVEPGAPGPWIWVVFDMASSPSVDPEDTMFRGYDLLDYRLKQTGQLGPLQLDFLSHYLPYCFLPHFAWQRGRAMAVAHFAQSLDGKIATIGGESRWIGNEANLEHAHRMRALCDGILIGRHTLDQDHPQLTVRRVEGPNPVRIVLGSQIKDCSSLLEASEESIIIFQREQTGLSEPSVRQIVYGGDEHYIPCLMILRKLFREGITSVLIEGGPQTTSRFLQDGLLDILQLHLAPMLLGSGRDSVQLPEINRIDHAVGFKHFFYQRVANTYMFVGQLQEPVSHENGSS